MRAWSRWALGLLAVGCAQPAPRPRPDLPASTGTASPAAVVTSVDATTGSVPDAETRPSLPTTIGDVTCLGDGDCALTTRADCCDCCASNARATSRAWLDWRDGTLCKQTRCEPCGKVKCPYFPPAEAFAARCESGSCVLRSAPGTATTSATTGMGFLTLLCAPACDQVVVDGGTDLGASPMYKTPISVGKHRLELRVTLPKTVKVVAVEIREGEATVVRVDMSP